MTALHLSLWSQGRILEYFWRMVREDADRIELLRQLATVVVQRPPDWSPEDIREQHVRARRRHHEKCFCCRTAERNLYWHHVILIANGGDNDHFNQVAICQRCHAAIHPWLDVAGAEQDKRRSSFTSVAEMAAECPKPAKVRE